MTAFRPIYTYEIRRPRSLNDATESLVLAPPAGAPHADPCKFSSAPVDGFLPYADAPVGMRGELEPLEATVDKGQLRIRLVDRQTPHNDNAKRWFTAFLHDANGQDQILGGKVVIRESLDGGVTFADYSVGRLEDYDCEDGKNEVELTVRDLSEDLDVDIFVDRPHSSITYAALQRLSPLGLTVAYADFPQVPKYKGNARIVTGLFRPTNPLVFPASGVSAEHTICTKTLAEHIDTTEDANDGGGTGNVLLQFLGGWGFAAEAVRIVAKRLDTQAAGEFKCKALWVRQWTGGAGPRRVIDVVPEALDPAHPKYMALPPAGTSVEWELYSTQGPTKGAPIVIGPVHPVQLLADLADGKFGYLTDAGAVTRSVPRNAASFAALIADTSFPLAKFVIDDKQKLNDWVEENLGKAYGIAYGWNAAGELVVYDTRHQTNPGALLTITDDDLVSIEEGVGWRRSRRGSITRADASLFVDQYVSVLRDARLPFVGNVSVPASGGEHFPDFPCHLFVSTEVPIKLDNLGGRALDFGEKKFTLKGTGYRAATREASKGLVAIEAQVQLLHKRLQDLKVPFASGPMEYTLNARRGSNADCRPGELRYLKTSFIVDPFFAQRMTDAVGAARLVRCTSRSDEGPLLALGFIDLAQAQTAAVPTLTIATVAGDKQAVDLGVTRNANSDPVLVELALTDASVGTAPAETSSLWTPVGVREANATFRVLRLASGKKVWARARSQAGAGERRYLPSAWVASTPASVTLTALTAPTGLTATQTTTRSTYLQWTNGEADREIEVFVSTGGAPGTWDNTLRIAVLPSGTTRYTLKGLDGPSAVHTVGVRHRDQAGGVSAMTTASVTTAGSGNPKAPAPPGRGFTIHRRALL